ncbi:MAG: FAD-dependent monooxygenase [Betaproteobacteria bacterium]|nr:FAD-dependent monooxygenase [Betaproteobacteria bacterium]
MAGTTTDVPVLIVGGGPVGLAAAIELAWRGIDCLLVERRDGSIGHPKMNQVSVRTMEICRRWGVARTVRERSVPEDFPRNIRFVTATSGYELAHYDFPARKDEPCTNSPEAIQRCSQIYFDVILREHAQSLGHALFAYRHELESFSQDADGVTADLTDLATGAKKRMRAGYVLACDGAESGIRAALGIPMVGDQSLNTNVNAFFSCTDHDALFRNGRAVMQWLIDGQGVWGDIVSVNGHDLWRFSLMRLPPGAQPGEEEMATHLRRAIGRDAAFEIHSVLPWERRRVVAKRFSEERVLLAGDAAHQMSPTGGFGMNTGIQEAVDACWKLAAVIQGWGGPQMLASYDLERRPVARMIVDEAARNFTQFSRLPKGEGIDADTPAGAALRKAIGDAIYAERFDREYVMEGVPLGYRVEDSPIVISDGTPTPPFEVMKYRPTARPGHRAPHAWLERDRSMLDLYGLGYTLVRFDPKIATAPLQAAARDRGVPMSVIDVADDTIAELYENNLVLVRPDGFVAWRGDAVPAQASGIIDVVRGA